VHPCILVAAAFLAASAPLALSVALPGPAAATVAVPAEETALEEAMEGIRAGMKALGKAIETKDGETAWRSVCSLQQHLLAAKQETPMKASSIPEGERAAWMSDFRSRISRLLQASCDVEIAILAGDHGEAGRVYEDVMWPMQKPAHEKFRND